MPKAAVVITNPDDRPAIRARQAGTVALKIRKIAEEHRILLVEKAPFVRAPYATVEVDQAIPPEFYNAVVEVFGHVLRLRAAVPR